MKWYVVKNEWGLWTSDHKPLDNFEDACFIAKMYSHLNVVSETLYKQLQDLPQTPSNHVEHRQKSDR